MAWNLGGQITRCDHREYGSAKMKMNKVGGEGSLSTLFRGLGDEMQVCPGFVPWSRRRKLIS